MRLLDFPDPLLNLGSLEVCLSNDDPDVLPCSICNCTAAEVHYANCGHYLCSRCILSIDSETFCAICMRSIHTIPIQISPEFIHSLNLQCACGKDGSLDDLRRHLITCKNSKRRTTVNVPQEESHTSLDTLSMAIGDANIRNSSQLEKDSVHSECQRLDNILVSTNERVERNTQETTDAVNLARSCIQENRRLRDEIEKQKKLLRELSVKLTIFDSSSVERFEQISRNVVEGNTRRLLAAEFEERSENFMNDVSAKIKSSFCSASAAFPLDLASLIHFCMNVEDQDSVDMSDGVQRYHTFDGYLCRISLKARKWTSNKCLGLFVEPRTSKNVSWPMKKMISFTFVSEDGTLLVTKCLRTFDATTNRAVHYNFEKPRDNGVGRGLAEFVPISKARGNVTLLVQMTDLV